MPNILLITLSTASAVLRLRLFPHRAEIIFRDYIVDCFGGIETSLPQILHCLLIENNQSDR